MSWFRASFNKEPAMVIAGIIAAGSLCLPYVVVPMRKTLGLPTYQWDNDPSTHPYLNYFGDNYKQHDFGDPQKLEKWSQHKEYRYTDKLVPKTSQERDFPEARQRLREKGSL